MAEDEEEFNGPTKDRSCTDVVFLLLFLVFLGFVIALAVFAIIKGDINLLINGYDSFGNVCGSKNYPIPGVPNSGMDMTQKTHVVFTNANSHLKGDDKVLISICASVCPNITIVTKSELIAKRKHYDLCLEGTSNRDIVPGVNCVELPSYPMISVLNRCVPDTLVSSITEKTKETANKLTNAIGENTFQTIIADVRTSWKEIVIMAIVGFVLSLVCVFVLKYLAALFIYFVVISIAVGSLVGSMYLWYTWYIEKEVLGSIPPEQRTPQQTKNVESLFVYSIAASIASVILVCLLLFLWSRIRLVIALFKESGEVVVSIPAVLVQPFFIFAAISVFFVFWVYILLLLASCKEHVIVDNYVVYELYQWTEYAFWFHLFTLFWISQFLVAVELLVIAGAVSAWYFTRDKTLLKNPLMRSIYNVFRYHLGSLALGSLIIAVVKMISAILTYIQVQLNKSSNQFTKFLLKCLACCIYVLEKFLKFINRNAYIMIAIYGYSFFTAAKRGFFLLLDNALRLSIINSIGDFCLFLAKLSVAIGTGVIGLKLVMMNENVTYSIVPLILGALFAFIIAHVFISVYEMIIDTLFLCFCEDSDRNNGKDKPYFMSQNLLEFVEGSKQELERREKEKKQKDEEKQKILESS